MDALVNNIEPACEITDWPTNDVNHTKDTPTIQSLRNLLYILYKWLKFVFVTGLLKKILIIILIWFNK